MSANRPFLGRLAFLFALSALLTAEALGDDLARRERRPFALAFSADGTRLYVANARSGSLSILDLATSRVTAEADLGRGLTDLAKLPTDGHWLAVDRVASALLVVEIRDDKARTLERLTVADGPVSVAVSPRGEVAAVASLGGRAVSFFSIEPGRNHEPPRLRETRRVALPFSPRRLAWIGDGERLVVADAFGGKLATVKPSTGDLGPVRDFPAHNIRGLALSPDGRTLAVSHQVAHRLARPTFEDVHWGSVMSNHVRWLLVESLISPDKNADPLRGSRLIDLGETGRAAGDPAGIAYDREGRLAVALAGVDEILIGPERPETPDRVRVGRGPSAIAFAPDGKTLAVVNSLDDSVSVMKMASGHEVANLPLGPRPDLDAVAHGERLFHDARLSHDGWMSCQSCHTDGETNGLILDTLGDGSLGAPKRVPSLLGVGRTPPWTWTGAIDRLEHQVRKSIESTMQGPKPSDEVVNDLTAYLRSLAPPLASGTAPAERGAQLFRSKGCAECHSPPEYTSKGRFDVGLVDEVGNRLFNPPSLRGVGRRSPLLHDGRVKTLERLFLEVKHPKGEELTKDEVADLVAFLKGL